MIVFFVSFLASALLSTVDDSRQERAVEKTVLALDTAYEDQDCEAFQDLVSEDLADLMVDGDFDCESWVAIATSLRTDGEYTYSVDVVDVQVTGDEASAYTEESADDGEIVGYAYALERGDDGWVIVGYDRR